MPRHSQGGVGGGWSRRGRPQGGQRACAPGGRGEEGMGRNPPSGCKGVSRSRGKFIDKPNGMRGSAFSPKTMLKLSIRFFFLITIIIISFGLVRNYWATRIFFFSVRIFGWRWIVTDFFSPGEMDYAFKRRKSEKGLIWRFS